MKSYYFFLTIIVMLLAVAVDTAAAAPRRYPYEDSNATEVKEMRDTLQDLKHELSNHEAEIRTFEDKFNSLDTSVEALRQEFADGSQAQKNMWKDSSTAFEIKLSSLEAMAKGMTADMRLFKNHANDTALALSQYEEKIKKLEKAIDAQNRNISNLESAINALTDAIQIKETLNEPLPSKKEITAKGDDVRGQSDKATYKYTVRPGDSLGKIASDNKTTIKAIKELNQLTKDSILVGQTLLLPSS